MLKITYFAFVIIASIIRTKYTWSRKQNQIKHAYNSVIDAILVVLPGLGMFIIPILYVLTNIFDFADYQLPQWSGWIGVILFIGANWLLWRSHADLGHNWSPTLQIKENHRLITHGIYHYIRHPMYAAHWLWGVAQIFLLQNWIAGFAMVITFLPGYLYRLSKEEKMMLHHFGDEYRQYMKRTGRMLPILGK